MLSTILNFLVSEAHADTVAAAAPQQGGGFSLLTMFIVFFLFLYFAVWRPQSKRAKETQSLLTSLAKGDEVVTIGGLLGKITKIADQYIVLSIGENVDIVMQKSSVASVLPKGTIKSVE